MFLERYPSSHSNHFLITSLLKTLLIVLSVCYHLQTQAQPKLDTLSILFIGNSYTYFNNLPVVVKSIAVTYAQTQSWVSCYRLTC